MMLLHGTNDTATTAVCTIVLPLTSLWAALLAGVGVSSVLLKSTLINPGSSEPTTITSAAGSQAPSSGRGSSDIGAIVGGVVGGLAGFILLGKHQLPTNRNNVLKFELQNGK